MSKKKPKMKLFALDTDQNFEDSPSIYAAESMEEAVANFYRCACLSEEDIVWAVEVDISSKVAFKPIIPEPKITFKRLK